MRARWRGTSLIMVAVLAAVVTGLVAGPVAAGAAAPATTPAAADDSLVSRLVQAMTLDEKLGRWQRAPPPRLATRRQPLGPAWSAGWFRR